MPPLTPEPLALVPRKPWPLRLIRPLVAVLILWYISTLVPFEDQLQRHKGGQSITLEGDISGNWQEPSVEFLPTAGTTPGPGWPAAAKSAWAEGRAYRFERRENGEDGFEWIPSITHAFTQIDLKQLGLAMGLFILASFIIATRWWRLLALVGCGTSWFNAVRLTYIGFCFNLVMPGATGGDVVKGVVAAKENPDRRADAVVSVVVDRILGLSALAVLATLVILISGATFAVLRTPLIVLILVGILGAAVFANKSLRRKLGISALLTRLPLGDKLQSLDQAALFYFRHPKQLALAFGMSLMNHLVVCTGVYVLAIGIGIDSATTGLSEFLVLAPVANMVSAIPIAPGGWGPGELAYRELFEMVNLSGNLGVVVSVTFKLCNLIGLGLLGGLFLLVPGTAAELRAVEVEDEPQGAA